jgi:hypothetical protein
LISEWILRNPSRAILKLIREIKGILGLQEFLDTRERAMPTYRIGGIAVEFPYNAYDCQLVYMERVISALQQVTKISSTNL